MTPKMGRALICDIMLAVQTQVDVYIKKLRFDWLQDSALSQEPHGSCCSVLLDVVLASVKVPQIVNCWHPKNTPRNDFQHFQLFYEEVRLFLSSPTL